MNTATFNALEQMRKNLRERPKVIRICFNCSQQKRLRCFVELPCHPPTYAQFKRRPNV